jgi:hypothetical protein
MPLPEHQLLEAYSGKNSLQNPSLALSGGSENWHLSISEALTSFQGSWCYSWAAQSVQIANILRHDNCGYFLKSPYLLDIHTEIFIICRWKLLRPSNGDIGVHYTLSLSDICLKMFLMKKNHILQKLKI